MENRRASLLETALAFKVAVSESATFGFKTVGAEEKQRLVGDVFSSVADRYDLMNDLMSGGLHRLWKDAFVRRIHAGPDAAIVDLAGGTGDIAVRLHQRTGAPVTVLDINADMLRAGRNRQFDRGQWKSLRWVTANAEALPIATHSLDVMTIAFGLRNVTHIDAALAEAYRVLKPGGTFLCLEFSRVTAPLLATLYDQYSFKVVPKMGEWVAKDRAAYQYLVESIRMFPTQEQLLQKMREAGFERAVYKNLTFGVVAIHQGWRV